MISVLKPSVALRAHMHAILAESLFELKLLATQ